MRRLEAERKRDSMSPARDSINGFKPDPEGIVSAEMITRIKRKIKNRDFASAKKKLGKILELDPKNKYAITLLIKLYLKMDDIKKAEDIFYENKITNNVFLYNVMLVGYGKNKKRGKAEEIFDEAVDKGIVDVYSYNSMIDMYCNELELEKVRKLFHEAVELEIANSYTYNRMIYTCARVVEKTPEDWIIEEAKRAFDKAVEAGIANEYTYTSMLSVYSNIGKTKPSMELLCEAIEKGLDISTAYKKVLYAFGNAGDLEGVKKVYTMAVRRGKATKEVDESFIKVRYGIRKASGGD